MMVNGHALPEADGVISKAQFLLNTSALSAEKFATNLNRHYTAA